MATATTTRASALMGLRCRACHLLQPADEGSVGAECAGAIEPEYDTASFDTDGLRGAIEHGPRSLWRYAPLLPIAAPESHFAVGWTPLIKAPRLGAEIGVSELYVKDDSRNPSLSFKDRPVALALARALELGLDTIACASTGNRAGAVAAAAARNGLRGFVFAPAGTDESKVAGPAAGGAPGVRVGGTHDQVTRLCARLADESGWGFVNFNLRPYYAEGSKTLLFECAEQLGWHLPEHVVVPVGSGALLTRTATAAAQLRATGLVDDERFAIHPAQPSGCAPVSDAGLARDRQVRAVGRPPTSSARRTRGSSREPHRPACDAAPPRGRRERDDHRRGRERERAREGDRRAVPRARCARAPRRRVRPLRERVRRWRGRALPRARGRPQREVHGRDPPRHVRRRGRTAAAAARRTRGLRLLHRRDDRHRRAADARHRLFRGRLAGP